MLSSLALVFITTLLQAKKKDLKSVTGYTRGTQGQRIIRASYIVEAPVWKTTYRLLFNTGSTCSSRTCVEPSDIGSSSNCYAEDAKSIIEGWALVDNTQNEDWRSVELSLVSGASNSFIYDLYNPRFAARTEVLNVMQYPFVSSSSPTFIRSRLNRRKHWRLPCLRMPWLSTMFRPSLKQRSRKKTVRSAWLSELLDVPNTPCQKNRKDLWSVPKLCLR